MFQIKVVRYASLMNKCYFLLIKKAYNFVFQMFLWDHCTHIVRPTALKNLLEKSWYQMFEPAVLRSLESPWHYDRNHIRVNVYLIIFRREHRLQL